MLGVLGVVHDGEPGTDIGAGDVGHQPARGQGPGLHHQQSVQCVWGHGPAHLNGITEHHVKDIISCPF